ncbi:uncharacterized protein LODBEIA_P51640 [Lodderomyces beijingensis]|uniref:EamA domain-containing protein n=1 Tax=Lodderomyces beijingensis TaxID=1775926 RepID=A0ABP0ZUR6_9ASCO
MPVQSPLSYSGSPISIRDTPLLSSVISNDPSAIVDFIQRQERRNYRVGITLLVVSVVTWVTGLELVNGVLKTSDYRKPVLFAIITGSCFLVNFLPDLLLIPQLFKRKKQAHETGEIEPLLTKREEKEAQNEEEMTGAQVATLAFYIAVIYFTYNLLVMEALQYTSASNQTVIGSTTAVFTLLMGCALNTERFSLKKAICVCFSCLGVFLVNTTARKSDGEGKFEPKDPKLGNTLALAGAFLYACYLLVMRIKCGGSSGKTTNERRLFGYVGVITILMGIPILIAADFFGVETFELPPPSERSTIFTSVFINGVFSVISDFTSILAMLLTSPLVVSLTLTSSIPITIFVDYMILIWTGEPIHSTSFVYVLGILCILVAVLMVNLNSSATDEMIDDVIEDALGNAITHDQVLSPILSPLLERPSLSMKPFLVKSPLWQQQQQEATTTTSSSSSSKMSVLHSPPATRVDIPRIPMFNLNENDESPPTHNRNHHPKLYESPSSYQSNPQLPSFVVTSGNNHRYRIELKDENDDTLIDV